MPNFCHAYYTVRQRLYPFLVEVASKPQIENISLLTFGLFAALHCQLPRIAAKLPLAGGSPAAPNGSCGASRTRPSQRRPGICRSRASCSPALQEARCA
jgi:hypothetical protein